MLNSIGRGPGRVPLLVLCLVTLTLPLNRLGQSLWSDEASSVWFARQPLSSLLTGLCDPHPPGYYLLLKAWSAAGGGRFEQQGEFWLRLPSLLAAALAVAVTFRLGREMCGPRCAWLAGLLLALHPLQSWYAGEARMYALAQCLGLLVMWLGWRLLSTPACDRPSARRGGWWGRPFQADQPSARAARRGEGWGRPFQAVQPSACAARRTAYVRLAAVYWLVALLALGVDYSVLLVVALLQLLWLARGCPCARRWVSLQAAVLAPAGLLWLNASQLQALRQGYPPVFLAIQASRMGLNLTPAGAARLLGLAVMGLALAAVGLAWSWRRRLDRQWHQPLVQVLVVGGWLALLMLAAVPRAFSIKREWVVLLPYLALLVGYVLGQLPRPVGELVASLGLLVTLLILPGHQREPWRAVVAELVQTRPDPSAVIWVDELAVPAYDYYLRHSRSDAGQVEWAPLFGAELPQLPDVAPRPGDSLWLLTAESTYRHLAVLLPEDFYREYELLEKRRELGIGLYRYRRRAEPLPDQVELPASHHPSDAWGLLLPSPLDTCRPR